MPRPPRPGLRPPPGRRAGARAAATPRYGLARALSKAGIASRTQAAALVAAGRVTLNGRTEQDPERPVDLARDRITLDGVAVEARERVYLVLNKPRGLVTTAADERGRDTVYTRLADAGLPWLAPVGRLDKASEGLLLFSNDSAWAAYVTAPASHLEKVYHVQVDCLPDEALLAALRTGVADGGERLAFKAVHELRRGERNAWLEIHLDQGRNRHIRRALGVLGVGVQRLVRVAIGPLALGSLPRGAWRHLTPAEVAQLAPAGSSFRRPRPGAGPP